MSDQAADRRSIDVIALIAEVLPESVRPVSNPPDVLTAYLMRRRELLIAELREVDRLLGRPQTVPVRER